MSDEVDRNPELRERALRFMFSKVGIIKGVGLELMEWDENTVKVKMPFSDFIDNRSGTPLGGAVTTLIDVAGAACVWAGHDFKRGGKHATISMSVNFVGAGRNQDLIAIATCVRRQRELNFVEIGVRTAEDDRLAASALMTFRITE